LTLCDPQTNGGLLIAVDKDGVNNVIDLLKNENHFFQQIGVLVEKQEKVIEIV
jgi:selenophosphate synthase